MIKQKTVLVLGAGASAAYGLPLGSELHRAIAGMSEDQLRAIPVPPGQTRAVGLERAFKQAFQRSQTNSIDEFLANRREFLELGRMVIAKMILPKELAEELLDRNPSDHWYKYLINQMHAPCARFGAGCAIDGRRWSGAE